ncbi:type II toxin-antitoxin system VapC family toxin [Candidatus Magnetobacterium casense]|uniref:type II toxin-antitoxin system VapC family toxin n=1 Tax=Candidatus Magnetobacterium casense TaxID=1455061 RepID=UPI00338F0874
MKTYLLDTNIISYLDDPRSRFHKPVVNRLSSLCSDDTVYISILSFYELQYSIFRILLKKQGKLYFPIKRHGFLLAQE